MEFETILWVQTQAPAGNWVDVLGVSYTTDPMSYKAAYDSAKSYERYQHAQDKMARTIQRQWEIVL
jgi:squalene cyclase